MDEVVLAQALGRNVRVQVLSNPVVIFCFRLVAGVKKSHEFSVFFSKLGLIYSCLDLADQELFVGLLQNVFPIVKHRFQVLLSPANFDINISLSLLLRFELFFLLQAHALLFLGRFRFF